MRQLSLATVLAIAMSLVGVARAAETPSRVVDRTIESKNFAASKVGTIASRKLAIYLPPGYDDAASTRYPVIYFLPSPFDGSYRNIFDGHAGQALFDRAIASGEIRKFILVSVDMATPIGYSWAANSPATGNWEDFFVGEVVPYMDSNFRTIASRDSRGISGIFMGGHGAIRLAMKHPDIFGAVYAMHPVGTDSGLRIMDSIPNLELLSNAMSINDVKTDGASFIFLGIFEAFLPDAAKPPLYIDVPARHDASGQLIIDSKLTANLRANFFLEEMIPEYADNLKSLRAFKFDWARSDGNQDHVYSNQAYTHKLNEFGIVHEAEEYNGAWGEPNWGDDGRIYSEVLPFFARHLVWESSR
jgi:S-formylglutathione hydrolase FrmB